MPAVNRRCSQAAGMQAEHIGEIEQALADGWQSEDGPIIAYHLEGLKAQLAEIGDLDGDFRTIVRVVTHGRRRAFDDVRVRKSDRENEELREHYRHRGYYSRERGWEEGRREEHGSRGRRRRRDYGGRRQEKASELPRFEAALWEQVECS